MSDDPHAPTPVQGVPVGSPLYQTQLHFDGIVRELGQRVGSRLDGHDEDLQQIALWKVDMVGAKGDNGKIGNLRGRVSLVTAVLAAIGMAVLGSVALAATAIYRAGDENGTSRLRLEQCERTGAENRAALEQLRNYVFRVPWGAPGEPP